jgi:hypothetical protein
MTAAQKEYQRLPGQGTRAFNLDSCTLWLARDHLLSVASTWITERYKRFYFRDIRAIVLCETKTWVALNWVFGLVTLFWLLIASMVFANASPGNFAAGVVWTVVAAIFAACFIGNLVAGATCVCEIHTAVQTEILPSLGRVRRARRIIARLKPLIEAAQEQAAGPEGAAAVSALTDSPSSELSARTASTAEPPTAVSGAAPGPP